MVLYDGECNFCRAQMGQLRWWDCQGRLAYLSIHDPRVAERWPDMPLDRLLQEMCIVTPEGDRHWGAEALRYLTRRLRRLWWLAPVMHIPGSMLLWRPLYRLVARNRFRLMGRSQDCASGACTLHHK